MPYKIDPAKCMACGACPGGCPVGAIIAAGGKYQINASACANCGICVSMCPMGAIVVDSPLPAGSGAESVPPVA
jgi:ferredoxin